jgi:pyridoxal 5'-phosphate synthase pdxT subunit
MKKSLRVGVLAFHGDVIEHLGALEKAAQNLKLQINMISVRTKESLKDLDGLIIPGGESTTLYKLCEREGMIPEMKKIKNIFGTCAGAIMLAKDISNNAPDQKTLALMDLSVDRNAYGAQAESFNESFKTELGNIEAIFIRAPRIKKIGKGVKVLAEKDGEILACEEKSKGKYYLAACFHPELTTSLFHEYFLKNMILS